MPLPAPHLETNFEVCHSTPAEREAFLAAYDEAHPGRRDSGEPSTGTRAISLTVPDLGSAQRNRAVDAMMAEYAHHLVRLIAALKD
jgi:hypothetical protein